jgi:hypothetical protein
VYKGGDVVTVDATLERIPLFLREGVPVLGTIKLPV